MGDIDKGGAFVPVLRREESETVVRDYEVKMFVLQQAREQPVVSEREAEQCGQRAQNRPCLAVSPRVSEFKRRKSDEAACRESTLEQQQAVAVSGEYNLMPFSEIPAYDGYAARGMTKPPVERCNENLHLSLRSIASAGAKTRQSHINHILITYY